MASISGPPASSTATSATTRPLLRFRRERAEGWILQPQFLIRLRLAQSFDDKSSPGEGLGDITQRPSVVTHFLGQPSPVFLDQLGVQIAGVEDADLVVDRMMR